MSKKIDRHEQITKEINELLNEFASLDTKEKLLSNRFGYIHLSLDYEKEELVMVILGSQNVFRTMIYSVLHKNDLAAQDIMEVVEAYRNEKFN